MTTVQLRAPARVRPVLLPMCALCAGAFSNIMPYLFERKQFNHFIGDFQVRYGCFVFFPLHPSHFSPLAFPLFFALFSSVLFLLFSLLSLSLRPSLFSVLSSLSPLAPPRTHTLADPCAGHVISVRSGALWRA